jgi:hypothetical protein
VRCWFLLRRRSLLTEGDSLSISVEVVTDTPGTPVSADPVLKAPGLKDSAGAATNSISASGFTTLSVTLTSPSGAPLANQLISVGGDQTQVKFPEGASGLTNAAGVASIKVARASLNASGAGALTVTFSYKVGSIPSYPDGSPPPTARQDDFHLCGLSTGYGQYHPGQPGCRCWHSCRLRYPPGVGAGESERRAYPHSGAGQLHCHLRANFTGLCIDE